MPNREDILREKTHKGQTDTLSQRVFYTLHQDQNLETHRIVKVIALLMNHLHEQGTLSEDAIDEILFDCVT